MPGVDGFKLQETLAETLPYLSVIFIGGHGDIPMTVKAIQGGATDFLEKPARGTDPNGGSVAHPASQQSRLKRARLPMKEIPLRRASRARHPTNEFDGPLFRSSG